MGVLQHGNDLPLYTRLGCSLNTSDFTPYHLSKVPIMMDNRVKATVTVCATSILQITSHVGFYVLSDLGGVAHDPDGLHTWRQNKTERSVNIHIVTAARSLTHDHVLQCMAMYHPHPADKSVSGLSLFLHRERVTHPASCTFRRHALQPR